MKIDKDAVAPIGQDKEMAAATSADYKRSIAAKLLAKEPDAFDDTCEIDVKEQAKEFFKNYPFGKG